MAGNERGEKSERGDGSKASSLFHRSNPLVDLRFTCLLYSELIDGIFDPIGCNFGRGSTALDLPVRGCVGGVPVTRTSTVVICKPISDSLCARDCLYRAEDPADPPSSTVKDTPFTAAVHTPGQVVQRK